MKQWLFVGGELQNIGSERFQIGSLSPSLTMRSHSSKSASRVAMCLASGGRPGLAGKRARKRKHAPIRPGASSALAVSALSLAHGEHFTHSFS